ncbi:MAG: nucleotidyltransferase [Lachnospiraceae bacterium]|nr:nucleotidyltransferase [Lachnospiraceae bacterium]
MKKTALVIMAAGIGSRFGKGIKQLEAVGPGGKTIIDYSVHDALEAGFNKVVLIIRKNLEKDFKKIIGQRIKQSTEVVYVFQELDDLPDGFTKPEKRTKPWGTGQAVLACKSLVHEPFAVINADDYYGKESFVKLHDYLIQDHPIRDGVQPICMVGFRLGNTLSDNGGVTRGVCVFDDQSHLVKIDEITNIVKTAEGAAVKSEQGLTPLDVDFRVSMNMWGFQPEFIDLLKNGFVKFLSKIKAEDLKKEYLLPIFINGLLQSGHAQIKVLDTQENWFGITYQEDRDIVVRAFQKLIADGVYSRNLYV